jgi:hypothetical protein
MLYDFNVSLRAFPLEIQEGDGMGVEHAIFIRKC